MKVGVYLVDNIHATVGGNFSYYDKLIGAIDNHPFDPRLDICFVGRVNAKQINTTKQYIKIAPKPLFKIFRALRKLGILRKLETLHINLDICTTVDHNILKKNKIDVLLYPKQFLKEVEHFPFITMNWDAGHKTTYAFPELMENFNFRENWYTQEIQKALAIFVESNASREEFSQYYNIPTKKIFVIPLFPGGVVELTVPIDRQQDILKKFELQKNTYFFYPAQYWAHKNHYTIIKAFKQLLQLHPDKEIKLVFSGSDKGNREYILSVIQNLQLRNSVLVLGFIENEEVYTLYKNAIALVMPTLLGPTNMPLLEAQHLGTPVIASDMKGHRETCENGALYADGLIVQQWIDGMVKMLDDESRKELIETANRVVKSSSFNIDNAIRQTEESLLQVSEIRKIFGS